MEKREFGKTGMRVSVLGFGGAEIGFQGVEASVVSRAIGSALDAGLNVIDTAECYAGSEELIGSTVSHRRADYFLFTKAGHADGWEAPNWSRKAILSSIQQSLTRLKTDCADLVQLHSCDEEVLRHGEAIGALEEARARGLTRFIGYSGDGQAARYAIESGRFDALQTSVSIADQESVDLLIPLAREKGLGVIAKRPIANAVWRNASRPEAEYYQPYWDRLQALDYSFLHDSRAAEIALRFTISVPGVHTAIVGTSRPERWHQNAEVVKQGALPLAEMEAIRGRWRAVASSSWTGQV